MLSTKQLIQRSLHFVLSVNLVFYSLAPAFSTPVFASTEAVENNQSAFISEEPANIAESQRANIQPLEKPVDIEPTPDPTIQPIDIGQIKPVEIIPEEIVPEENKLPTEDANRDGEEPEPYIQKDEIKSLTDKLNINTDTNTGAFNYNYPLEVPAGRNNLQPDLALSYNNQDTNNQNLFGYGWSLNIPSIERLNKTGIDNLYTDNYFTSSLGGELTAISLSDDIHGTYGPRVENGDFLKYEYTTSSTWLITDKMGVVYTFGKTLADRQDDPNDNTRIYKWLLSEVRDTNDNFIRYQYYKDAGQIYPEKIFYTGHTQTDGIFEVEFVREDRTDNLSSFQTGFSVTNNYRFSQILVKINNQWQKKYYLNYEIGDNGNRSLLGGIQQAAPSQEQGLEATMPEDEFGYQVNAGWNDTSYVLPVDFIQVGGPDVTDLGVDIVDINGDGLADLVKGINGVRSVYLNDGQNWVLNTSYILPYDLIVGDKNTGSNIADVNGDNLADFLISRRDYNNLQNNIQEVYINNGQNWVLDTAYSLPVFFVQWADNGADVLSEDLGVRLVDINGDGLVDILSSTSTWYFQDSAVYLNNGVGGWIESASYVSPVDFMLGRMDYGVRLADVNGDGLVDILHGVDAGGHPEAQKNDAYINNGQNWVLNENYILPTYFVQNDHGYFVDYGTRLADINGDGFIDVLRKRQGEDSEMYINTGDGWARNYYYGIPWNILGGPYMTDQGVRFADINGDGADDFFRGHQNISRSIELNDSSHEFLNNINDNQKNININYQASAQYTEPGTQVSMSAERDAEVLMPPASFSYQVSSSTDITLDDNITLPYVFSSYYYELEGGIQLADINGDSLVDIIASWYESAQNHPNAVYINNGSGWTEDASWIVPLDFVDYHNPGDLGVRLADLNGDGLVDMVQSHYTGGNFTLTTSVYINNGFGWTLDGNYVFPEPFVDHMGRDMGGRLADVNGDGLVDLIRSRQGEPGNVNRVYLNDGGTNMLTHISNSHSSNIDIDYQASAQSRDVGDVLANPKLPYVIQTVQQINVFDGVATSTIDYNYSGGEQYFDAEHPRDKKFAGFAKVEKTISNKTTRTYYQQGNVTNTDFGESTDTYAKIGKVYRQEVYDAEDLKSTSIQKWQESNLNNYNESIGFFAGFTNDANTVSLWHMDGLGGSADKRDNAQENNNFDLIEYNNPQAVLSFDTRRADGAYQFNGVDQYLSFTPYNPGVENFTIEGWIKSGGVGGHQPIFYQEQNSGNGRPNIELFLSNGHLGCNASQFGWQGSDDQSVVSSSIIVDNTWTYIACSRQNGVYKIYINGALDSSNSYDSNNVVSGINSPAYFGRRYNTVYPFAQYYFNGAIDEWRISNIARSDVEIQDFYQNYLDYIQTLFIKFVYSPEKSQIDFASSTVATATQSDYDLTNGNLLAENNLGQVDLDINTGEILDNLVGDEKTTTYDYAQNEIKHILSAPKEKVITDSTATKSQALYYDDLPLGQVNKVNLTKEDYLVDNVEVNRDFNTLGLVVAETDPENNTSNIVYDEYNLYPSQISNTLNQTTHTEYNLLNGQVATSTAANGAMTVNSFDAFGRLVKTQISSPSSTTALLTKQEIIYQDFEFPRYKETKDYFDLNQYKVQREYYDGLDRVIQTKTQTANASQWSTQDIAYDTQGRVARQSLPYISQDISYSSPDLQQSAKSYIYDAQDRVLTETTPVGTTSYIYNGLTTSIYDANSRRKDLVKDAHGNLVQVKEYNAQDIYTTNYEYSLTNKLSKITDAQGNIRNFVYDDLDNLISQDMIHRLDAQNIPIISYTYDKNGNVLSQTNFNNQVISYTYDDLNRVLSESVNGSIKMTYTYDQGTNNVGKLTYVNYNHNGNWQSYNYNLLNQLTDYDVRIHGDNYAMNYGYNLNGNLKQIDYPNSKIANYTFNNIGQVSAVSVATSTIASNLQYNINGQLVHLERANGLITDYSYTPAQAYRLTNLSTTNASSTLQDISYTYDAVGNILNITDTANTDLKKSATYQYDDLNRLASTTVSYINIPNSNYSQQFTYDAIGNILSNSALGTYNYTLANPQQLSSIPNQNFIYDNAGNLLTDSQKTLTWDWRSRMTKSQNTGSQNITNYTYDSNNQRLMKQTQEPLDIILAPKGGVSGLSGGANPPPAQYITIAEEHYIDQYYERNDKNNDTKDHVFINGQKVATINNNNAPYYIISDHLNSSSILVDNAGNIAEVSDYRPFGSSAYTNTITDLKNDYAFTGKETDEESTLQYFGARYMDNNIGRFVSVDPAVLTFGNAKEFKDKYDRSLEFHLSNPQNLNAYSYVINNPLKYTDPDGEIIPLLVIGGMVVAGILFNNIQAAQAPTTTNAPSQSIATESKDFAELVSPKYDSLSSIQKFGLGLMTFGITNKVSNYGVKVSNKIVVDLADSTIEKKFIKHVEKQGEFGGNITKEEFKNTLENIWKGSGNLLQKIRDNGDILRYDVEKNIFSSIKNNGVLKTIFQPKEGIDYWLKQ